MKTTNIPPYGTSLLLVFLFLVSFPAFSQSPFSKEGEARFYTGISPVILPKEGIEINVLNNMTSFWLAVNEYNPTSNNVRVANRYRFSRMQHLIRVTYGFSDSGRWDLGVEGQYTHSRIDDRARSSPFTVLTNETTGGNSFRGMSLLGVRLRVMPFESVPGLTTQLTAHFPINKNETTRVQLGAQRTQVGLTATYYNNFNSKTFYFLQGDWRTRLSNSELDVTAHLPSLSGFMVFDAWEQQFYIFPGLTYAPTLQQLRSGGALRKVNQQLLGSIGALYQPVDPFGVMLNFQVPFILESGSTTTEWVRESYSAFTLGIRVLL
ncbi:MAG: hypothetical protein AAFZ15_22050 [Bacteroidota bacterium]